MKKANAIAYNDSQAITINLKPFLKWVGGKTRLIPQYTALGLIPAEFNTYFF